jgi:hypothetical protein
MVLDSGIVPRFIDHGSVTASFYRLGRRINTHVEVGLMDQVV